MLRAMAAVAFSKVEGLGNDFILLDRMDLDGDRLRVEIEWAQGHARALCDRRRGIGADGILVVGAGRGEALASMTVVNFDGSRPEMCGNGLRCVASFVAERLGVERVSIDTDAGCKACEVSSSGDGVREVRIDMGPASLLGDRTPASGRGRRFAGVSIGNPHAIDFVAADEDPELLARSLGPAIELDPAYAPSKTNVEFAQAIHGAIVLWVWERGVGITEACGTGACATVVAAAHAGLVAFDAAIEVRLPGGHLWITAPRDGDRGVIMRGPCRQVFSGVIETAGLRTSSSPSSESSSSES